MNIFIFKFANIKISLIFSRSMMCNNWKHADKKGGKNMVEHTHSRASFRPFIPIFQFFETVLRTFVSPGEIFL